MGPVPDGVCRSMDERVDEVRQDVSLRVRSVLKARPSSAHQLDEREATTFPRSARCAIRSHPLIAGRPNVHPQA